MKQAFFLLGLLLFAFTIKPNSFATDKPNPEKVFIVIKNNNTSVWNSSPVKIIRHIGYFWFTLRGCCYSIATIGGPIVDPRHAPEFFLGGLIGALLNFGFAQLIKVKNEPEITEVITNENNKNNFIVIRQ